MTSDELLKRLKKYAALGNNVYSPWPQKELEEAAAHIREQDDAITDLVDVLADLCQVLVDVPFILDEHGHESTAQDLREIGISARALIAKHKVDKLRQGKGR